MNEQLRQRAQEIADEHCNDAYSVALAMLKESKVTQDRLDRASREISRLSLYNAIDLGKIKAEAIREAIGHAVMSDKQQTLDNQGLNSSLWAYNIMYQYANKLENQNEIK